MKPDIRTIKHELKLEATRLHGNIRPCGNKTFDECYTEHTIRGERRLYFWFNIGSAGSTSVLFRTLETVCSATTPVRYGVSRKEPGRRRLRVVLGKATIPAAFDAPDFHDKVMTHVSAKHPGWSLMGYCPDNAIATEAA